MESLYVMDQPKKERSDKAPECKIKPLIWGKEEAAAKNVEDRVTIPKVSSGLLKSESIGKLEAEIAFLNH